VRRQQRSNFQLFYEGLKVEGFSRNQNLTVEYHSADGDYARLPQLAADLVNRQVTLISAFGTSAALAAKAATAKISIVFAVDANPIDIGLVASLDHPGANIIGMGAERERKRLELLHAALPAVPSPQPSEFQPGRTNQRCARVRPEDRCADKAVPGEYRT
jgi:ABC-type uncharacterized transport system substrate-binding protein